MQLRQDLWSPSNGWGDGSEQWDGAHLVLAFAARELLDDSAAFEAVSRRFPGADVALCSTAGEICGTRVSDGSLVATAVRFDHTRIRAIQLSLRDIGASYDIGAALSRELAAPDLVHILILSDGLAVNGSELAAGVTAQAPEHTSITGGLSADADRFQRTLVGLNGQHAPDAVVAIGFYGTRLRVRHGSQGGWDPFGPDRLITRSTGSKLYELDGQSALALYRKYLGPYAKDLPASGLLFPLLVHDEGCQGRVRTVLAIDDRAQSMTFAGDIPQGSYARLMKANFDRLIHGATGAAEACLGGTASEPPQLALLISCVGRKLVLQQRIEEEVESVQEVLGPETTLTGFYSYGELSPATAAGQCELHNQTMTITTFTEV